jgi:protein-disulfide isomerase
MVRKNANMRLCYAPFPLSGHPHGMPAAQTAMFARDYGKFWQMHDLLFDNQTAFSDQMFGTLAKKLGLDEKLLAKALGSGKYKDELDASREMGKAAGVDSTPSIFFNGRKLTLLPSVESLAVSYDDELEWSERSAWPSN